MRRAGKHLYVAEFTIRSVVHEDLRYKICGMKRGQFISSKISEIPVIRSKRLLSKLKHVQSFKKKH